ncbi:MAG: NAD-dependent epimerase/dehydratase family protein [Anaerolineae bacterium]|nr:NAD-dependent epimerase/dehydratase family protein [Anaerolineae bacterium]
MKYFVTGATGFIGGHVARQLVEAGHRVTALARDPAKATDLAALGVTVWQGDILDKESMRAPMTGVDGVFHIAAWYKVGAKDASMAYRINVEGTRSVLELMHELEIPKGVYTSTLAVFSDTGGRVVDENYYMTGEFLSEYDRTKWVAHYQVALPMIEKGLPLVVVLPGLVYGPGDHSSVRTAVVQYLQGRLPVSPQKTAFCWAHVEDTARGHLLAMEKGKPGASYIIAGPVYTFIEALAMAEQITGVPAPRLHPGPGTMRALSKLMRFVERFMPVPEVYASEMLRILAGVTYLGSHAKARRELGYTLRPFEEGWRETLYHEMELLGMR